MTYKPFRDFKRRERLRLKRMMWMNTLIKPNKRVYSLFELYLKLFRMRLFKTPMKILFKSCGVSQSNTYDLKRV